MFAHKVDGENPAGYSDLLLTAQKLEWRAEARDTLLPKTAVTSGSHVTHPQTTGNWAGRKWKHRIFGWWRGQSVRHSGEEQISLWSISFTSPRQSNYTNRKTEVVVGDHLMRDCLEDINKSTWKVDLNTKEGMAKKGGWASQKSAAAQWTSPDETP